MSISIAIYEDNQFLRNSLQESLSMIEDFEIVGAFENCNEVIEQLTSLKPKVVLMDIGMPGVN